MPILLNKTIRLFLDSIGKREEYQYYLKRFHASRSAAFALICPDRLGFEEVADMLAFDLLFLLRLEIFPAILLSGVGSDEMRDMLMDGNHQFEELDLSGRVLNAKTLEEIKAFLAGCRERRRIGVLVTIGRTYSEVLPRLIPEISKRVHLIRLRGPLHSKAGTALMNYSTRRPDRPDLEQADQPAALMASDLLEMFPELHISIASPWNMLQELFTVKGAGCLVRRGSIIRRIDNPRDIDREKLSDLMYSSFGRRIEDAALDRAAYAFLEENYRGAALLEQHDSGWYLSKFAVGSQARGEGLAAEIWGELTADNPPLFWRARRANPINHWYRRHADGFHNIGDWSIFWRNVDWHSIPEIIDYCVERPQDFHPDTN